MSVLFMSNFHLNEDRISYCINVKCNIFLVNRKFDQCQMLHKSNVGSIKCLKNVQKIPK